MTAFQSTPDLLLRSRRVVTPQGTRPASVRVRGGEIARVEAFATHAAGLDVIDFGDAVIMPGLVDTHVHVNEPGRTEWEGFATATRAAAAGGVTTLLDMPLNSIPATTSAAALRIKVAAAEGQCAVNVGFIGGVVPGNAAELRPLVEAGVRAFKAFLVPSGVEEFPAVGEADLREALPILAALGTTLMVHAELPERLIPAAAMARNRYAGYLASRPDAAECEAVALVSRLAEEYGASVHIVHLSSAASLPVLRAARERGVRITAETCPHYLTFGADEIGDGATEVKCAPPIRGPEHREALWQALVRGDIDLIASDHSPAPPSLKALDSGDFLSAWGGIASLQLGLAAVWEGARTRGVDVERVTEWMCAAPARLAGLGHRKGRLAEGYDADLVVWNPDTSFVVGERPLYHRHSLTPYRGRVLHGVVQATLVAGHKVYADETLSDSLHGALLLPAHR